MNLEVRGIDFEAKIVEKSILDGLRSLLGDLKGILEASWGILVAFCGLLGLSWATWRPLGGVLGRWKHVLRRRGGGEAAPHRGGGRVPHGPVGLKIEVGRGVPHGPVS